MSGSRPGTGGSSDSMCPTVYTCADGTLGDQAG